MSELLSVFTEKYSNKVNKIINSVIAINPKTNIAMPSKALWDTGGNWNLHIKRIGFKIKAIPYWNATN